MALVALLSAREGARERVVPGHSGALIDFGGQSLVEYQARLAINAGAERILIQTDVPAPDLARIVDRIAAEKQRNVALVPDMITLSRGLASDDDVVLLGENLILPHEALHSLLAAGPAAVLALPSVPATARFERIDGDAMWAGALRLPGADVLATLDMLGDWDLSLTLLRRAVQQGAQRVELSPELAMDGRLTLVRDQASADLALQALSDRNQAEIAGHAAGLGSLFAPPTRALVRELVRRQIEPSNVAALALLLCAGGLALAVSAWMIPAMIVMLLALSASELAHQSALVTLRATGSPWRHRIVQAGAFVALALLGFRLSGGQLLALSGAWLPLFLIALFTLAEERLPPPGLWGRWTRLTVAMATTLILIGLLFGMAGPAFALLGLLTALVVAVRLLSGGPAGV